MNGAHSNQLYLAFDGGGTATRAVLFDAKGNALAAESGGPSNPVSLGLAASLATLARLGHALLEGRDASSCVVAAGVSGARNQPRRDAIARGLFHSLGVQRALVSSDVDMLVHANVGAGAGIVVIAGTGSSVVAKTAGETPRLLGGRGELFGEVGSAYQIAASALRAAADSLDGLVEPTKLTAVLPQAAGLSAFVELVGWCQGASKLEIARLAQDVMNLAETGDAVARRCVLEQVDQIARLTANAAEQMRISHQAPVYVYGALFEAQGTYFEWYRAALKRLSAKKLSHPQLAPKRGPEAALELARAATLPAFVSVVDVMTSGGRLDMPPTEAIRGGDTPLDHLSADEIVARMSRADQRAVDAVAGAQASIAALIERVVQNFREGGRLLYLGAGTSGRLGVLDASECAPTFGVGPDLVVGIIAGGEEALRSSVEGAEDDEQAAVADLDALTPALSDRDVVVGIAASGTTPYVLAGLKAAKTQRAFTALVCCNPRVSQGADCIVALDTGPEVLPGSTRLKAGTATKLVLNMISTGAMVLSGRVFEGYMVGVRPMNAKLRRRATRIVGVLTGRPEAKATALLEQAGDSIPVAVLMGRLGLSRSAAESKLKAVKGSLRDALESD